MHASVGEEEPLRAVGHFEFLLPSTTTSRGLLVSSVRGLKNNESTKTKYLKMQRKKLFRIRQNTKFSLTSNAILVFYLSKLNSSTGNSLTIASHSVCTALYIVSLSSAKNWEKFQASSHPSRR